MADRRFELSDLDAELDDLENRVLAAKAKLKRVEALNVELLTILEQITERYADVLIANNIRASSLVDDARTLIVKARGKPQRVDLEDAE